MSNTPIKKEMSSLENNIIILDTEIKVAREEVAKGNTVDLSIFLNKVRDFCDNIKNNLPAKKDAPAVRASIETLLSNLTDLSQELTNLEVDNNKKKDDIDKNGEEY